MVTRIVRWLVFTVLVALLPFAFFVARAFSHNEPTGWAEIAGGGDLYLLAGAFTASAVGELVGSGSDRWPVRKLAAAGLAVLLLALSSLLFADAFAARSAGAADNLDRRAVGGMSAVVLVLAVVASGGCVALAEK